ncbi:MAG TPA: hypothetical protein VE643_02785 [Nitrososphaeraceae archaeon]|nr:hypothetical protein [Nitrososphaeraceae archaeon]
MNESKHGSTRNPSEHDNTSDNHVDDILARRHLFCYRPKKDVHEPKGVEDVQRFFIITASEKRSEMKGKRIAENVVDHYLDLVPKGRDEVGRAFPPFWACHVCQLFD